jgi:branched-subunit amino acid transport protein
MIMNSKRPSGQSIIKTGLAAVFAGLCIGIFDVCYEWSWNNLLSGIVAGIAFTLAFFTGTVVLGLSKDKWRLYLHSAIAGVVGGLTWWLVARTDASVFVSMMVGGVGAPIAMWLETRNWKTKTP